MIIAHVASGCDGYQANQVATTVFKVTREPTTDMANKVRDTAMRRGRLEHHQLLVSIGSSGSQERRCRLGYLLWCLSLRSPNYVGSG